MKINIKDMEKLQDELNRVQNSCRERTLTAQDIVDILSGIKVPKSYLNGTGVFWYGSEKLPRSYKYTAQSTHFIAMNIKGKWYIIDIFRDTCPNRESKGEIAYSDAAKIWIIKQASEIK